MYMYISNALILLITLMLCSTDHICAHVLLLLHTHNVIHVHIHMHPEPSLTLDTLTSVLDGVQRLDGDFGVGDYLQIPDSKQDEHKHQYDRKQLPRAFSIVFLTDNPSPSWSTVALALWQEIEHGALEVVQKLYLKGEPCAHSCRSEGRIGSLLATLILFHPAEAVFL